MHFLPTSKLGKLAMWLSIAFLFIILVFFISLILHWVSFNEGIWWNLTLVIATPVAVTSLILSVLAVILKDEHALWNYFTIAIGVAVILFLLAQSLLL